MVTTLPRAMQSATLPQGSRRLSPPIKPFHGRHASNTWRSHMIAAALAPFSDVEAQPVLQDGQPTQFPASSGVYAVIDRDGNVQYVGVSRTISLSVETHAKALSEEEVTAVKYGLVENATKEALVEAWKEWLQECVNASGKIPPGNDKEKAKWQPKRAPAAKPEIKLTSGKGADDLTVGIKDLIEMVVKNERIVAFIKGTRTSPQCGFSYQMLTTLNTMRADYQVVNVLDEVYNPGLREAIKEFSAWPTIPQLYIEGEFVGGNDIVQEMMGNGELAKLVRGLKG